MVQGGARLHTIYTQCSPMCNRARPRGPPNKHTFPLFKYVLIEFVMKGCVAHATVETNHGHTHPTSKQQLQRATKKPASNKQAEATAPTQLLPFCFVCTTLVAPRTDPVIAIKEER